MIHKENTDLKIRLCEPDDFPFIFNLLKQLWPNLAVSFEDYQKVYNQGLESENQKLIVALINNEIVGCCCLTIKNNLWQIGNLGYLDILIVDENTRGRGIGRKLVDHITTIAIQNDCKRIDLDSAFYRTDAHVFYEKLGYEKIAYLISKTIDIG
jgi:N-acetylglutamate synthase-like GNAT family acetyltransferase